MNQIDHKGNGDDTLVLVNVLRYSLTLNSYQHSVSCNENPFILNLSSTCILHSLMAFVSVPSRRWPHKRHMCAVNTNMTRSVGDAFFTNSPTPHNTLQLFKNLPYDREVSLHSNHNVQPHDRERCSAE